MDQSLHDITIIEALSHQDGREASAGYWVQVRQALDALGDEKSTAVVGGNCNAGKSTLINRLIGIDILPVYSAPETGVPCYLTAGDCNRAHATSITGEVTEIGVRPEAIAAASSLLSATGTRRPRSEFPSRIDITFSGTPIQSGAGWVDCPGINDDPLMSKIAMDVALKGDVIVWVLGTRQFLSTVERSFLEEVMALRGHEAVAFVINVFLEEDTEEAWTRFRGRELNINLRRLHDWFATLELVGAPPPVLVTSARASVHPNDDLFGLKTVQDFLSEVADPNCARVRASRRRRLERAVTRYRAVLAPRIEQASLQLATTQRATDDFNAVMRNRRTFRRTFADWPGKFAETLRDRISAAAERVRRQIGTGELARDSAYETAINSALDDITSAQALYDQLDRELARYRVGPLSSEARRSIRLCFQFRRVSLAVADTPLPKGRIGAGGLLLLIAFPLGVAGVAAAMASAIAKKKADDVRITQCRLSEAISEMQQGIDEMSHKISTIVLRTCLGADPSEPSKPEPGLFQALTDIDKLCQDLLRTYPVPTQTP